MLIASLVLFASIQASAQATITWVSGVGDDANPCSRTAPCKTYASAISKTTAGGEIDALDPASFGALTITKAITIDGGPNAGGIIVSGTNGIVVSAGTSDVVTIRNTNFVCTGTCLNGVLVNSAKAVRLQHDDIAGFTGHGISVISPTTLFVDGTTVHESGQNGLNIAPGSNSYALITNSHFQNNINGIVANDFAKITVSSTRASGNSNAGFLVQAASSGAAINIINCDIAFNTLTGVQAIGSGSAIATIRLSGTSFTSNGVAIVSSGAASVLSFTNNPITGAGVPTGPIALQ